MGKKYNVSENEVRERQNPPMKTEDPEAWGLDVDQRGELVVGAYSTVELARTYSTPLHVVNELRLEQTAWEFQDSVASAYPGKSSVHYAFKCNSVPGVVEVIRRAGLKAEVMTEFELALALRLGYKGEEIIVNGPCKNAAFLRGCVQAKVRFIVVDSLDELQDLAIVASSAQKDVDILLRVNPDYVPHGMNRGSATGSRRSCAFGFDLKGGEVGAALNLLPQIPRLHFQGFHLHIGTGIGDPKDYSRALCCLPGLINLARSETFSVKVLDVGGGFASMTTRELTSFEMLAYEGFGRMPRAALLGNHAGPSEFAKEIAGAVLQSFMADELPELIYEPGRCIVSSNQLLLLTVHRIKERPGITKWLVTDGGLGTVTLPTYYEYHEVFLCDDVHRPRTEKVTIIGPACFAGDVVYRNKRMPRVQVGEVLAIMDSGAYFTALESSFGFPRPAIVAVHGTSHRIVRSRETFEEMSQRDSFGGSA